MWWIFLGGIVVITGVIWHKTKTLRSLLVSRPSGSFTPYHSYGIATFPHRGKTQRIFVPYDRKMVENQSHQQVMLTMPHGAPPIDITQKPGVPYFLRPIDFGATGYVIKDRRTGEQVHAGSAGDVITWA